MFKKFLNLTACVATVFAQEESAVAAEPEITLKEGTPMALATSTADDIVNIGYTGETYWE
jgi:hypothetical protein